MNWCSLTSSEVVKCGRWLCTCGHTALDHAVYDEDCYYCYEDTNNDVYCGCKRFQFANNDNCTLECKMKYLAEINK